MIRNVVNRLVVGLISGALTVVGIWTAIEGIAAVVGRRSNLLPVDYRSWWRTMQGWDPTTADLTATFVLVALTGLLICLFELWPGRPNPDLVLVDEPTTHVRLRQASLATYISDRWEELDWVDRARARVRVDGGRAQVTGRPVASRAVTAEEIADAKRRTEGDLAAAGVATSTVQILPPKPSSDTRRPR